MKKYSLKDFIKAVILVKSRSFGEPDSVSNSQMIPMHDMLNHRSIDPNCHPSFIKDDTFTSMTALRDIKAGEELCHNYARSSEEVYFDYFFIAYGFFNEEVAYYLNYSFELTQEDPMYEYKKELLKD